MSVMQLWQDQRPLGGIVDYTQSLDKERTFSFLLIFFTYFLLFIIDIKILIVKVLFMHIKNFKYVLIFKDFKYKINKICLLHFIGKMYLFIRRLFI